MAVAAAAVAAGVSLSARAVPGVNMTFEWSGSQYTSGYSGTYINGNDAIGLYAFHVNSSDLPGVTAGSTIYSVCLSPAGLLDGGNYNYTAETFVQASPGINPSLWASPFRAANAGINNAAYLFSKYASPTMGADAATALEFAIWTALYNSTGYGAVGSTGAWVQPTLSDPEIVSDYTGYLGDLKPSATPLTSYQKYILEGQPNPISSLGNPNVTPTSGQAQEFFFLVPEGGSTLLLLSAAFSGIALLRKRLTV